MNKRPLLLLCSIVALLMLTVAAGAQEKAGNASVLDMLPKVRKTSPQAPFYRVRHIKPSSVRKAQPILTTGDGTTLWGTLLASTAYTDDSQMGMYSFIASQNPATEQIVSNSDFFPNSGGVIHDGRYQFVTRENSYAATFHEYYTSDWTPTGYNGRMLNGMDLVATDLTYDATDGKVYGCFVDTQSGKYVIGTANFTTFRRTDIFSVSVDSMLVAIAASPKGELYGITWHGDLFKIDKNSASMTKVGATGVTPLLYTQSATFDQKSGKMYWATVTSDTSGALYEVNLSTGRAQRVCDFPNGEEWGALYVPAESANSGAPSRITDLQTNPVGATTDVSVTFTMPSTTFSGAALSGSLTYYISANGTLVKQGTAAAGAKVNETVSLTAGSQIVKVYTSNAAGQSPEAKTSAWVGYDVPKPAANVSLSFSGTTANVSWTAPKEGVHGGYIGNLTYNIVRYPDSVTVATGLTKTSFSEAVADSVAKNYVYGVTVVNGDKHSAESRSNGKVFGEAYDLPYHDDFSDNSTLSQWHTVDANNDGKTWQISYNGRVSYQFASVNADDWMVSPELRLSSSGKTDVSFNFSASKYFPEKVELWYGQGDDVSKYTQFCPATTIASDGQTIDTSFVVPSDGVYRLAARCVSDKDQMTLYFNSLDVTRGLTLATPDSVRSLTVTPAAQGVYQATVAFTAPSTTIGGKTLQSISKIEVYRNDSLISTINNPTVGSRQTVTDNGMPNGTATYKVLPYNESGAGQPRSISAYIGEDVPLAPKSVSLVDNGNGTATLSWNSPGSNGVSGGYVIPSRLKYNVYKTAEDGSGDAALVLTTTQNKYTFNIDGDGTQKFLYFGVSAVSAAGEGVIESSSSIITGAAYNVPFRETFPKADKFDNNMWWSSATGTNSFELTSPSADESQFSASFKAAKAGDIALLGTGKISLEGTTNPYLTFSIDKQAVSHANDMMLMVSIDEAGTGSYDNATVIRYSQLKGTGWQQFAIPLSKYIDLPYIIIRFAAMSNNTDSTVRFDNVVVREVPQYDVAVSMKSPAKRVRTGQKTTLTATVENTGANVARDIAVYLSSADGTPVDTARIASLSPFEKDTVAFSYTPAITLKDSIKLTASVDYARDLDYSNNDASSYLKVLGSVLPRVSTLSATENGELTWQAPHGEDGKYTDDFEDYDAWTISDLGDWTLVDGDKGSEGLIGNRKGGVKQLASDKFAYVVFNPYDYDMDVSDNVDASGNYIGFPSYKPHSGRQFLMACVTTQYWTTPLGGNDDWLISPELSGDAQTISMWIGKYLDNYGRHETYEILYSTTTTDTAAFVTLAKDSVVRGKFYEVTYDLPAGAKYFAVRYTGRGQNGIDIDDVTYEMAIPQIIGYNIYRDGVLVATVDADKHSFNDTQVGQVYNVSVIYSKGESGLSNDAMPGVTGIDRIDAAESHTGSGNGAVYDLQGRRVADSEADFNRLSRGVYIINNKKIIKK